MLGKYFPVSEVDTVNKGRENTFSCQRDTRDSCYPCLPQKQDLFASFHMISHPGNLIDESLSLRSMC